MDSLITAAAFALPRKSGDVSPAIMPGWSRLVVAALLAVFAVQAYTASRRDSVTVDEFMHLPVGYYMLTSGDFRPDPSNPPWPRMIAALPLLWTRPALDPQPSSTSWDMGWLFMVRNAASYHSLFMRGRAMVILIALLTGILVVRWAVQLFGWAAGLTAALLFSFSPSMLAHGHLVTPDMAGAFGFLLTAHATWRLIDRPAMGRACALGVAVGAANLLKLSASVLAAVVIADVALCLARRGSRVSPRELGRWSILLAVAAATALVVLNLGYGFDGTFAPLGRAKLAPGGMLARLRDSAPWLRLPLPLPFITGLGWAMGAGGARQPTYFLFGELSTTGWWYYHLAAFAVKTPLPLLAATVLAFALWLAGGSRTARYDCLFTPVVLLFTANALFNSRAIGVRHVLPAYPLLIVAASPLFAGPLCAILAGRHSARQAGAALLAAAGLVWLIAVSLLIAPRYLEFFNRAAGGPAAGYRLLIDSNFDWGQDLIRLKEYMERRGLESVNLAYFGRVHPGIYGIHFRPLERRTAHGTTVVSASFLMGRPYAWYRGGRLRWVRARTYTWLRRYEPIDRVGAMFVYDLP